MCWRYGVSSWLSAAISLFACISAIFTQAQTPSPSVQIILRPQANHEETIKQLRVLGLRGEMQVAPRVWFGYLPQENIGRAGQLPGVYMVTLQSSAPNRISPDHYHVRFRVKLDADSRAPTQRWIQYQELIKHLQRVGFEQEPLKAEEWRYNDILRGKLPAKAVPTLLNISHVRSIVLIPSGWDATLESTEPVLVEIWLTNGFDYARQQRIRRLARESLDKLGFVEAIAHDSEFGMRLFGWLPANRVYALLEPAHELEEPNYAELPLLRAPNYISLFHLAEVLTQPGKLQPPKVSQPTPGWPEKVTPELKLSPEILSLIGQAGGNKKLHRVELIFRDISNAYELFGRVRSLVESAELEGSLGPILWVRLPVGDIPKLAELPEISSIRLPQPPLDIGQGTQGQRCLHYVRLGEFRPIHNSPAPLLRYREPLRVAILATDFRGWENRRGRTLPAETYLVDYTRWFSPDLEPTPAPLVSDAGLAIAEEISRIAPVQELYLVRIRETAPYQVAEVLRRIDGVPEMPVLMRQRLADISLQASVLAEEERKLRLSKQRLLFDLRLDDPAYWKKRDEFLQMEKHWQAQKRRHSELVYRVSEFLDLERRLMRANTVVVVPWWRDGYPTLPDVRFGLRWLPELRAKHVSYIQVVPEQSEGEWWGWWRDRNSNGVMEFRNLDLPRYVELRPEDWPYRRANVWPRNVSAELNWLGWQAWPEQGKGATMPARVASAGLPPQATIQLVVQWREAHDPRWANAGEDFYRKPLTSMVVEVLQPLVGSDAALPQDLYTIVARSEGLPERVENHSRYAIYELRLQFRTGKMSERYAVRLRGNPPTSTAPPGISQQQAEGQEIWLRLSAEVVEQPLRQQGRVVWLTPGETFTLTEPSPATKPGEQ